MTAFAPGRRNRRRALGPFSTTMVLWLVVIGIVAFIGSLVVGSFGARQQSGNDGAAHALSRSAIGFSGAVELLRKAGVEVEISRNYHPDDYGASLLVVTPPPHASPEAVGALVFDGPRLIVLSKWAPGRHPHNGWVRGRRLFPGQFVLQPINGEKGEARLSVASGQRAYSLFGAVGDHVADTGKIDRLQTLDGDGWTPVVVAEGGGIVLARRNDVWILSDPDLLNTHGLSSLATAKAGLGLLQRVRQGDGPVIFDVSLNGIQSDRSLLQLVFEPPFLGVTLALGLAVLLLAVQAVGRFGPPVERGRSFALGKQALADNAAALIRMARREHRMADRYALYVRGEAARAVGAPHALSEADLEALLDRLSAQQRLTPFTHLRREAAAAQDLGSALIVARRLYSWRLEMTRERR